MSALVLGFLTHSLHFNSKEGMLAEIADAAFTWVMQELKPTLEGFDITVVHLPRRISTELAENRDCLLRREPALGCVTTAEAIARCLNETSPVSMAFHYVAILTP